MSNNSTITINHHPHHHNHNSRISNGSQACAACKYQRRKCAPDCILAPYFPHDRQRQFLNAHKLFGVSNITKIIRNLSPLEKDMAMRTIIFQSDARAKDPVGGCYRIIAELNHQYEYYRAELDLVLQQLQLCKAQVNQQQNAQLSSFQMANSSPINDQNNQGSNELVTCEDENYHQYHQALMRFYDDEENQANNEQRYLNFSLQNGEDQNSWGVLGNEEGVLASSNSSTANGECEGLEMKPRIQVDINGGSYDKDKEYGSKLDHSCHKIDPYCCDHLQGGLLMFAPNQRTELRGEIVALKEEKVVIQNPEDESFHHIPEHNLRNAATLLTLTD